MEIFKKAVAVLRSVMHTGAGGFIIYDEHGDVVYSDDPTVPVVIKPTNIWKSVEADAWSRNFRYLEYVGLCARMKIVPQSAYAYVKISQALQCIMDNDPQMQPSDDSMSIISQEF